MPAQKRPPPSPSAAGSSSPPPTSAPPVESVEKKPKLEENGTAGVDPNGNDSGAKAAAGEPAAPAAGSDSETEDATAANLEFVPVKLTDIRKEVQCPICLGIIRSARVLYIANFGNNECPACRTHCASRRSLRDDPNYDALISALYPDIDKYEEEELAFNEEENDRNMQIQASIAEAFRKQSEVIGKKSTAKATAAAFVRRSRRNMRDNGQTTYFWGRGGGGSDAAALACSDDEDDGNGENCGKELSYAGESSPEKKQKRLPKWPTPRSSPARAVCNEEIASDDKEDVGIVRENFGTSPLRAWGKNGTRSQSRHGNLSGSSGRMVKGGRMIKLVGCLRNSDDNDSERDVHFSLLPLDGQTTPNLDKSYLCCGPTLSIKHLCQFVASQTSRNDEEVEMYALKPSYSDIASTDKSSLDKARLAGEERLSDLCSSYTFPSGVLELVYAMKMAN